MSNNIFSYTNRSLESSRNEGISKIPIISRGDWTDLNPTDPGMIILDYVHALVDMVQYYQDHNALEAFISTAKERKNIFRLAQQLSYEIPSAKCATVDVKFYLNNKYSSTIYIPKHTKLSTSTKIKFLTTEDAYINAGMLEVTVPCIQGELGIEYYTGTGISKYSSIEGAEDQIYRLQKPNIDIDTIEIIDQTNYIWNPINSVVFSEASDKVYEKVLNYDDSIDIKFGDGVRGYLPKEGEELIIKYIHTLADEGSTGANTINIIESTITDLNGFNIKDIYVTNIKPTSGGSRPQSDEDIVKNAPYAIKSQGRAVTLSDFENLAKTVTGVHDAKAYDINTAPTLCLHHEVKVLIIPESGDTASTSLLNSVYDTLYSKMIPPTNLQVVSPSLIYVDIDITVRRNPSYLEGGIEQSVVRKVEEYFNNRRSSIGESFNPNELISIVSGLPGIYYVESITPDATINSESLSVIKARNIEVHLV